jgi:DNA-binding CsgD family transcriptional regulator
MIRGRSVATGSRRWLLQSVVVTSPMFCSRLCTKASALTILWCLPSRRMAVPAPWPRSAVSPAGRPTASLETMLRPTGSVAIRTCHASSPPTPDRCRSTPPVSYRLYGREYRKRFSEAVEIVDKVAFSVRAPDGCVLYANFHRLVDTGRFDATARTTLLQYSAMLGAALGRHRQLTAGARCLDASGPAFTILTPREREVCSGILAGMTSEAIAYTLGVTPNTVLTLRRRAYARLGIVSQNQLVRLSLRYR